MDRNGNADVLPPFKSSTKGNVKAHESNVSGALPLVGGVQVQQLFEEETNQQNKGKVANEIQGLPSVHRPVSYSGNASPASGRRSSLNGSALPPQFGTRYFLVFSSCAFLQVSSEGMCE